MIKFEEAADADFQAISSKLLMMAQKAKNKIVDNWQAWERSRSKQNLSSPQHLQLAQKMESLQEAPEPSRKYDLPMKLPFRRNQNFTGRQSILEDIHVAFQRGPQPEGTLVAIYGAGGLGKTQIALEYAYLYQSEYSAVIWIDAQSTSTTFGSVASFVQRVVDQYADSSKSDPDYSQIARQLRLSGLIDLEGRLNFQGRQSRVVEAALHWLHQDGNDRWLMIFDNVDDLETFDVSEYMPSSAHRRILLTSRRTETPLLGQGFALDQMSLAESLSLFGKSLKRDIEVMTQSGKCLTCQ